MIWIMAVGSSGAALDGSASPFGRNLGDQQKEKKKPLDARLPLDAHARIGLWVQSQPVAALHPSSFVLACESFARRRKGLAIDRDPSTIS